MEEDEEEEDIVGGGEIGVGSNGSSADLGKIGGRAPRQGCIA